MGIHANEGSPAPWNLPAIRLSLTTNLGETRNLSPKYIQSLACAPFLFKCATFKIKKTRTFASSRQCTANEKKKKIAVTISLNLPPADHLQVLKHLGSDASVCRLGGTPLLTPVTNFISHAPWRTTGFRVISRKIEESTECSIDVILARHDGAVEREAISAFYRCSNC